MCARSTCRSCGKPTWSGCGNHIEQALRGVPQSERCKGHPRTASAAATATPKSGGFLSRLFGGG
jgi:hypothetical protein